MEIVLQVLVAISCLFLVFLGARTMFAPHSMVAIIAIKPEGAAGLNTMRGFLGGLLIGSSIVLTAGLVTGNTIFFLAVATVMGTVIIGRLIGIAIDGFDKKMTFPLIAEIIMVTIFIVAHTQLKIE